MALDLKRETISKIVNKGTPAVNEGVDFVKILKGINDIAGHLKDTTREAREIVKGYQDLKQTFVPAGQGQQMGRPQVKRTIEANFEHVAPAQSPVTPPPVVEVKEVKPPVEEVNLTSNETEEEKLKRAEALFKRAHEELKPYIPMMGNFSALQVFQLCLQPANKKKIIDAIAREMKQ